MGAKKISIEELSKRCDEISTVPSDVELDTPYCSILFDIENKKFQFLITTKRLLRNMGNSSAIQADATHIRLVYLLDILF